MDIQETIEEYLLSRQPALGAATFQWYDYFLTQFGQWCTQHRLTQVSQITAGQVAQFVAARGNENSNTLHHRAQIVKTFLRWCAEDEELGVSERTLRRLVMPTQRQPEITVYSPDDLQRLLRACRRTEQPLRNQAIVQVLLDTGVRASELCYNGRRPGEETGLRMENMVLGHGDSYVWVLGKGKKGRRLRIGTTTTLALKKYLHRERGHDESPYVFLSTRYAGEPLSVRMLQQLLHELGELAHVEHTHAHRFRHTFAVSQLLGGTSDLVLMQLLGHTTLEATKIYTRAMTAVQASEAAPSVVDTLNNVRSTRASRRR